MILAKKLGNDLFQDFYPDGWQTKMFDEFFNRSKGGTHDWSPPTDIVETEKEYIVEMEIPGMKEEDINLDLLYYNVDSFRQIVTGKFPERKYPENLDYFKYFTYSGQHG